MMKSFAIYLNLTGHVVRTGSVPAKDVRRQKANLGEAIYEGVVDPVRERINLTTLEPEPIPGIDQILADRETAHLAKAVAARANADAHRANLKDIAVGNIGSVQVALERIAQAILDRGY